MYKYNTRQQRALLALVHRCRLISTKSICEQCGDHSLYTWFWCWKKYEWCMSVFNLLLDFETFNCCMCNDNLFSSFCSYIYLIFFVCRVFFRKKVRRDFFSEDSDMWIVMDQPPRFIYSWYEYIIQILLCLLWNLLFGIFSAIKYMFLLICIININEYNKIIQTFNLILIAL